jgi:hypothetical protein
MKPYKAQIYLYADSEAEIAEFEQIFHALVNDKRAHGIAVRANKLSEALKRYGNNYFVNQYFI